MKPVADYVHSKGLKFGIYTDRGTATCVGRPGSQGHEKEDATTYAAWGVDLVKEVRARRLPLSAARCLRCVWSFLAPPPAEDWRFAIKLPKYGPENPKRIAG